MGFNYYSVRDKAINGGLTDDKCLRCQCRETWEHIILCDAIPDMKTKYLQTMKSKIQKVKEIEHLQDPINWLMSDIETYLNRDGEDEYNTTQGIVGIDLLFRG